mgnify:CR=1 FL=1
MSLILNGDGTITNDAGTSIDFGAENITTTGTVTGVGSGLTSLPAANLTGSVADARLPSNLQSFPAPGSANNVLTSNGSAWTSAAAGAGGAWEVVSSGTASGDLTVSSISKTTRIVVVYYGAPSLTVQYSTDNGSSFLSSGIEVCAEDTGSTTTFTNGSSGLATAGIGTFTAGHIDYTIFNPEVADTVSASFSCSGTVSSRGVYHVLNGHVRFNSSTAVDCVKIGGISSGDRFTVLKMTY